MTEGEHEVEDDQESGEVLLASTWSRNKKRGRRCWCFSILLAAVVLVLFVLVIGLAAGLSVNAEGRLPSDPLQRALALLDKYPVADGLVYIATCLQ